MIQFQKVSFSYKKTPLFHDLSLTIGRGEKWVVVGPSGCGKSTLLNLISALAKPTDGRILINGQLLQKPRYKTGLILQDYGLLPWSTVRENILLGKRLQGRSRESFTGKFNTNTMPEYQKWVAELRLSDLQYKFPHQLSGGQKQRAAIARTFILNPDLILLDEPFSALDEPTRKDLSAEIETYCAQTGATLVMVSHSIQEAAQLCDHMLVITDLKKHPPLIKQLARDQFERAKQIEEIRDLIDIAQREASENK